MSFVTRRGFKIGVGAVPLAAIGLSEGEKYAEMEAANRVV